MKKSTKSLVVAGGVAATAVGLGALALYLSAAKASLTKPPAPGSKKEPSKNPYTPGATRLPTSGKQAIPDPWTPVEWQPKMWPVWWPDGARPW